MNEDVQFQFFLAKLFGRPVTQTGVDGTLTGYAWRGNLYVVGYKEALKEPNHKRLS